MTTATLAPRPEAGVLPVSAEPAEVWLSTEQAAALLVWHPDTVRKRARASWAGRGPRLHGHHSSNGSPGGDWRFPLAALEVFRRNGSWDDQVRACGPQCPESTPATTAPTPARPAYRSPGRRR